MSGAGDIDTLVYALLGLGMALVFVAVGFHGFNIFNELFNRRLHQDDDAEIDEEEFAYAQRMRGRMEGARKLGNYFVLMATVMFIIMVIVVSRLSLAHHDKQAPDGDLAAPQAPYSTSA